jgi:putative copper export protein
MDVKLFSQAIAKFLGGLLMVGLLLFLPAGSFGYWQGWLLMGILFIPMFIAGLIMMKKASESSKKDERRCEKPLQRSITVRKLQAVWMGTH